MDMCNEKYSLCARILHIPLNRFHYTEDTQVEFLPPSVNMTQTCIKSNLNYKAAIDEISNSHYNYKNNTLGPCSIKRLVDLTEPLAADEDIDVLCYYIYYTEGKESEFPVAKQLLYYQRTNGELRVFTKLGSEVLENINRYE